MPEQSGNSSKRGVTAGSRLLAGFQRGLDVAQRAAEPLALDGGRGGMGFQSRCIGVRRGAQQMQYPLVHILTAVRSAQLAYRVVDPIKHRLPHPVANPIKEVQIIASMLALSVFPPPRQYWHTEAGVVNYRDSGSMSSRVWVADSADLQDQPILLMLPDCVILESTAATVWCDPLVPEPMQKGIAKDPHRFIRSAASLPVKISRETLVLQVEMPLGQESIVVAVKQYCRHSLWKAVAGLARRPKAVRNWAKAQFLAARDIATPRPILACLLRDWASLGGSFLVTQWVGGENLHLFGWRLAKRPPVERLRIAAECADSLGRLVGRMHAAGAAHRDLKAANLVVVEKDGRLETWLVDLDGLQIGRSVSLARRARDIARLAAGLAAHPWVTHSISRRFLRAYLSAYPGNATDWKPLWRAIAARAAQIVHRKQKRGQDVL